MFIAMSCQYDSRSLDSGKPSILEPHQNFPPILCCCLSHGNPVATVLQDQSLHVLQQAISSSCVQCGASSQLPKCGSLRVGSVLPAPLKVGASSSQPPHWGQFSQEDVTEHSVEVAGKVQDHRNRHGSQLQLGPGCSSPWPWVSAQATQIDMALVTVWS